MLFITLKSFAGSNGENCYPSKDTLSKLLGISEETVTKYCKELRNGGFITYDQADVHGRFASNTYVLYENGDAPKPEQTPPDRIGKNPARCLTNPANPHPISTQQGNHVPERQPEVPKERIEEPKNPAPPLSDSLPSQESDHQKAIRIWCEHYEGQYGRKFLIDGKEGKALKELLKHGLSPEGILKLAIKVRKLPDKYRAAQGLAFSALRANLNHLQGILSERESEFE